MTLRDGYILGNLNKGVKIKMNEQLSDTMQEAAILLIEKSMDGLDKATGFLTAEIPEYVYQLLLWHGIKSAIFCVIAFLFLCLSIKMFFNKTGISKAEARKAFKEKEAWTRYNGNPDSRLSSTQYDFIVIMPFDYMGSKIASFCFAVISIMFFNLHWLQILIAPKVWLVEYASSLVK